MNLSLGPYTEVYVDGRLVAKTTDKGYTMVALDLPEAAQVEGFEDERGHRVITIVSANKKSNK